MVRLTRRQFVSTASAAAASSLLLKSCGGDNSAPTASPGVAGLETTTVRLGFIPDFAAAPLIVAQEQEFFLKHGLKEVKLVKQSSWKVLRDNTELGSANGGIEGGQYQMPMPHLMTMGLMTSDSQKLPMYSLLQLITQGNAIAIASKHKGNNLALDTSKAKTYIEQLKSNNTPFTAAHTYSQCNQDLWLRYWLAAGGINPDLDVKLTAVPPAQTVAQMKTGVIDGLCAGDPWVYRIAGSDQVGFTAALTAQIWQNHPEEYFALRADWVDKHPNTTKAILKALIEAQQWLDSQENRQAAVTLMGERKYLNIKPDIMRAPMSGWYVMGDERPDVQDLKLGPLYWKDERGSVSYPYKSHDLWFLTENIRWGWLPKDTETKKLIDAVNREDLWRAAANELGIAATDIPTEPSRGLETFFDGISFDPTNPQAYLASLKVKNIRA